jgi:ADP-ribose pyrophosphatase
VTEGIIGSPVPATGGHDYQVVGRVERFTNRMISLVSDQVVMPGGQVAARDYVRHVGAVGVVALDERDRVALVGQYRHPVGRHLWELPAGLIDVAGESLVGAAARELAEEADLTAARWDLLVDMNPSPGCSDEVIRIFLARQLAAVAVADRHVRSHEEAELITTWVDLDEAIAAALAGEIGNGACLVGLLAAAASRARGWATLRSVDEPLVR